jgi:hypothetical protein
MTSQITLDALNLNKGYDIIDARKYRHVAAILSNGQRTARWSQDKETGTWYVSKGWKIPNRRAPLNAEQAAWVESQIS